MSFYYAAIHFHYCIRRHCISTSSYFDLGLARVLFQELYNNDVISEETFYTWESSKEFPDGKGVTISSVKDFISWLRQAEEESNEEDSALVFN